MTYGIRNPGPSLGQAQKCGVRQPVNGIPTNHPPLDNWISNDNTDKSKHVLISYY